MTRILADLPDEDIKWLDQLAAEQGKSRAAVLREAVEAYRAESQKEGFEKYFGLWERHGSTVDGLDYERQLRDEWLDVSDVTLAKKKRNTA
jgi:hypothetical protein